MVDLVKTWRCTKCNKELPLSGFYVNKKLNPTTPYWLVCRKCYQENRKSSKRVKLEINPEIIQQLNQEYSRSKTLISDILRKLNSKRLPEDLRERKDIQEELRGEGLELLGVGLSRLTVGIPGTNLALKYEFNQEQPQNKTEVKSYEDTIKPNVKLAKYFLPLIDWDTTGGYRWIVLPKVKEIRQQQELKASDTPNTETSKRDFNAQQRDKFGRLSDKVESELEKIGVFMGDLHSENIGVWQNRPVVLDWGWSPPEIRRRDKDE